MQNSPLVCLWPMKCRAPKRWNHHAFPCDTGGHPADKYHHYDEVSLERFFQGPEILADRFSTQPCNWSKLWIHMWFATNHPLFLSYSWPSSQVYTKLCFLLGKSPWSAVKPLTRKILQPQQLMPLSKQTSQLGADQKRVPSQRTSCFLPRNECEARILQCKVKGGNLDPGAGP